MCSGLLAGKGFGSVGDTPEKYPREVLRRWWIESGGCLSGAADVQRAPIWRRFTKVSSVPGALWGAVESGLLHKESSRKSARQFINIMRHRIIVGFNSAIFFSKKNFFRNFFSKFFFQKVFSKKFFEKRVFFRKRFSKKYFFKKRLFFSKKTFVGFWKGLFSWYVCIL